MPTPLRLTMTRLRLQQKDLAAAVGVSRMAVGAWIHGRSVPRTDNVKAILLYLRKFDSRITAADVLEEVL